MFTLKPLPYASDSLAPHISKKTMELHHDKHHKTYIDNLNALIKDTPMADMILEEIIRQSANDETRVSLFNNAGQTYNHYFFWDSLRPAGGSPMPESLLKLVERDFGGFDKMVEEYKATALGQFGSGWAWLVLDNGKLRVMKTSNGEPVFLREVTPLLALDVWEHSYYLDYENRRADYLEAVLKNLMNWDFAAKNANL
ncbi:MAG: superoxide dismutase [Bacillota bacterium]